MPMKLPQSSSGKGPPDLTATVNEMVKENCELAETYAVLDSQVTTPDGNPVVAKITVRLIPMVNVIAESDMIIETVNLMREQKKEMDSE